ncbi:MAG: APC family permease [Acidimicrobiia bacterium]
MTEDVGDPPSATLRRELGLGGAVVTGLGSILGTGAFVSIGLASAMWGDAVVLAIPLAAGVAVFNGLSSAFLAGRFPVAGGTYEYGYRTLNPWLGYTSGWLFILAKTASAASASLGVAIYLGADSFLVPIVAAVGVTAMVAVGLRRTTLVNLLLLTATVLAILWFASTGLREDGATPLTVGVVDWSLPAAVAFLFVAYTGYGRIATLGEEVHRPEKVIPVAVVVTLAVAALLYMGIELGGRSLGGEAWGELIRLGFVDDPVVKVGAVTAMLGVLLNLVLGLSRVWLAMGRRGDMPAGLAHLDRRRQPLAAIAVSGTLIALVTLVGDIGLAWSFSAMTVLLYYGLTNLATLSVDRSRVTAWAGLISCASLSLFVPPPVWLIGAGLIGAGLLWRLVFGFLGGEPAPD